MKKTPVRSRSFRFLLPVLMALPLSAGASSGGPAPEAKCGAIVNKAFSQARVPIVRPEQRRIGFLGYGMMAKAPALVLKSLQFPVSAWTRTPKPDAEIPTRRRSSCATTIRR